MAQTGNMKNQRKDNKYLHYIKFYVDVKTFYFPPNKSQVSSAGSTQARRSPISPKDISACRGCRRRPPHRRPPRRHLPAAGGAGGGAGAAGTGVPGRATLPGYAQACVANLVAAAVRLVPRGQTDGQRITAQLEAAVDAAVARAGVTALDDLASATLASDIAAMQHETQYTRLFRS